MSDTAASSRFERTSRPPTSMASLIAGSWRKTAALTNTITNSGGTLRSTSTYVVAAPRTSTLPERRAMPMSVPTMRVRTMPTLATRSVFLMPTAMASRTGWLARKSEYAISIEAGRSRNPKSVSIPRMARLVVRLSYRYAPSTTTPATTTTCAATRWTRTSSQGGGRRGTSVETLAALIACASAPVRYRYGGA